MKQLIRSFEGYFSCSVICLTDEESPDRRNGKNEAANGDILPVDREDGTEVFVSRERLQNTCSVLWKFPEVRRLSPGDLEHMLQCSRMISMKLANQRKEEELHLYRQAAQLLGERAEAGIVLLDTAGGTLYQNNIARNRHIVERYREYILQFEDPRPTNRGEYTVSLEGTVPVRLDIRGIYSGDTFLGRIVYANSRFSDKAEEQDARLPVAEGFSHILGKDPVIKKTVRIAERAAETDTTVLLKGESGTGKEQFARAIHFLSARRTKPFVAINCAAIPEQLLESELFGYEEGAFTGATKGGKLGKIEAADTGTIFLDEIGDMPLNLQAKLLRVLQRREFERVGGTTPIRVNVRFISATHRDLQELMRNGIFRSDLFYRLNVVPIHIPALREHREDVGILLNYYLKKYALTAGREFKYFSYRAMRALAAYTWPGNIRELENVVQYCLTMSVGDVINTDDLPTGILPGSGEISFKETVKKEEPMTPEILIQRLKGKRKASPRDIMKLLEFYGNDTEAKRRAAGHLGISLATLYRRVNEGGAS